MFKVYLAFFYRCSCLAAGQLATHTNALIFLKLRLFEASCSAATCHSMMIADTCFTPYVLKVYLIFEYKILNKYTIAKWINLSLISHISLIKHIVNKLPRVYNNKEQISVNRKPGTSAPINIQQMVQHHHVFKSTHWQNHNNVDFFSTYS